MEARSVSARGSSRQYSRRSRAERSALLRIATTRSLVLSRTTDFSPSAIPFLSSGLRRDPGGYRRGIVRGLIASAGLHLFVALAIILWPARAPRPVRLGGGALSLSVRLGSPGGGAGEPARMMTPPVAKPPETAAAKKSEPVVKPPPKSDFPKKEAALPVPTKMDPAVPAGQGDASKAHDATVAPVGSGAGSGGGSGGGSGKGGGGGDGGPLQITGVEEGQFASDYYLDSVIGRISATWTPPTRGGGNPGERAAVLKFRIMAHGQVLKAEIETSSGNPAFDKSAQEAVMRAQPFPPFPPAYRGQWLTLHLRFVFGV